MFMKRFKQVAAAEQAAEPGRQCPPDGIDAQKLARELVRDGNRAAERHVSAHPTL